MRLPKGTYFIGDPCYVIADRQWKNFCNEVFFEDSGKFKGGESFKGTPLFQHGTAYGDGCYTDGAYDYGVDAGVIGATPKSLWGAKFTMKRLKELGRIVTFNKSFEAFEEDGRFYIDDIEIDTN